MGDSPFGEHRVSPLAPRRADHAAHDRPRDPHEHRSRAQRTQSHPPRLVRLSVCDPNTHHPRRALPAARTGIPPMPRRWCSLIRLDPEIPINNRGPRLNRSKLLARRFAQILRLNRPSPHARLIDKRDNGGLFAPLFRHRTRGVHCFCAGILHCCPHIWLSIRLSAQTHFVLRNPPAPVSHALLVAHTPGRVLGPYPSQNAHPTPLSSPPRQIHAQKKSR